MLSSRACLVSACLVVSLDLVLYLLVIYVLWCRLVILFLSVYCGSGFMSLDASGLGFYFFFCVLLVSFPLSFSIFYKLFMSVVIFSCGFGVLFCWVLYRISEQFYLLKYLMSCGVPKTFFGLFSVV